MLRLRCASVGLSSQSSPAQSAPRVDSSVPIDIFGIISSGSASVALPVAASYTTDVNEYPGFAVRI